MRYATLEFLNEVEALSKKRKVKRMNTEVKI